ncbi:hypothetical protein [Nitrosomonas ureae]|uniref:HIRAN domain-containing protein n=1 Tax=Nitrosomonas ureae TaxID=44577 RepID=A0A1H5U8V2_9PROT|nr:hypothetical protein [Nitrosomonas ureae]SEF71399.1 hypothetical protein SAMN05216334_10719 [Nitrosomonas ureae]
MNKQPQSSTDLPENQKPQISILALLIVSLFIGLIAGAGVDKSYILPIVFISAVILISNRNKIANAVQPEKSPQQHIKPAADYYNWPESGQFACIIAAAPRQQVIQQLAQENGINPDDNPVTKTHILKARLITDNSNPFDSDVVHIDIDGRTVYYLSREESRSFRRRLDEKGVSNQIIICNAIISGSSEANNKPLRYTVKLDIEPF